LSFLSLPATVCWKNAMLRCQNCGAPLPEPEDGSDYVACTYCQTLTALPKLAAPLAPPAPAPRPLDPELVAQVSAAARTGIRLLVGVLVLSGAVIVFSTRPNEALEHIS
jgi:hypothetical protein